MTVEEVAQIVHGMARGNLRAVVNGIAQLETAKADELAYAEGSRAVANATRSVAACILVTDASALPHQTTVEVRHPKLAFIQAAQALAPKVPPPSGIHPTAIVSLRARLEEAAYAGPRVVIEEDARIGARTALLAGVTVGAGAEIGTDCVLHPGVVLYPGARIQNRVILHAGVVIGGDGFGYVFAEDRHQKFPQIGGVTIEDDVEIGCNSTVDRGSLGTTVIGAGSKIDNLVQIAHNVRIGRHVIVAAQTGISGSVEIGDYVVIGGQVGIGDHVRIESRAVVGSGAGILPGKIIREGSVVWGTPARPLTEIKTLYSHFARLPEFTRRLKEIESRIKGR